MQVLVAAVRRARAPHLLEVAERKGLDDGVMGTPLPHETFFYHSIEEERERYLDLFYFTRDPRNVKALDFNPCKYSTVVDGHEIQVQKRNRSMHVSLSDPRRACVQLCAHDCRQPGIICLPALHARDVQPPRPALGSVQPSSQCSW